MTPDRGTAMLALGALTGALIAALGIASPEPHVTVPEGVVAVVDGVSISLEDYHRALEGFSSERRDGRLDAALRRRVLDRLIDRELLVLRGVDLGLPERDPRLRALLTETVVGFIAARAEAVEVPEEALRAFYVQHRTRFRRLGRARVRRLVFSHRGSGGVDRAQARARAARAKLAQGIVFDEIKAESDTPIAPVPDALLPEAKLRDYLGPAQVEVLIGLASGEVSEPIEGQGSTALLLLVERIPGRAPPFDDIRDQVLAEHQRQAGELAVRRFLDARRTSAAISVAEDRL